MFVVFLPGCASATKKEKIQFGAWVTYWDFEGGMSFAQKEEPLLRDIYFFAVALNPEGRPFLVKTDRPSKKSIAQIRSLNRKPWMTVVNDVHSQDGSYLLKDADVIHIMLKDPEKRNTHRKEIVRLAVSEGFLGVDIDYENLLAEDKDLFTLFIRELSEDLKKEAIQLSVTVQPKKGPSRAVGPGAADWAELCRTVDRLQIMLYNLHNGKTDPGPMATLTWIEQVWRYAQKECGAEKLVPILKVSGMLWGPEGVKGIHFEEAMLLAQEHRSGIQRNPDGLSPYFQHSSGEKQHTVYFEDARSLGEKVSLLESLGCRRLLFWSLGKQDPALFSELQSLQF